MSEGKRYMKRVDSESADRKKTDRKEWMARVVIFLGILLLAALIPVRYRLKDGGTVVYKAVLYEVTDWHALTGVEDEYKTGVTVEILGLEVYDGTIIAE